MKKRCSPISASNLHRMGPGPLSVAHSYIRSHPSDGVLITLMPTSSFSVMCQRIIKTRTRKTMSVPHLNMVTMDSSNGKIIHYLQDWSRGFFNNTHVLSFFSILSQNLTYFLFIFLVLLKCKD
ncbi:hypothetical protein AMTRI_Chr13g116640 [Amborella trichopoda]